MKVNLCHCLDSFVYDRITERNGISSVVFQTGATNFGQFSKCDKRKNFVRKTSLVRSQKDRIVCPYTASMVFSRVIEAETRAYTMFKYAKDVWQNNIAFYLHGMSFYHRPYGFPG